MISYDFSNRVAVVTGASGGMGLAITNRILNAGGSVLMLDLKPEPDEIKGEPSKRMYSQGDLTDSRFVSDSINEAASRFGRIDYLANVAGVLWFDRDKSLLDIDLKVWDQVFATNLKSMVYTCRAAVPHMKKQSSAAMVHFSSTQCLRGDPLPQDAYSSAKGSVGVLSKSLAMQLAADNIRSNTIFPGLTQTPMQARWDTDEKIAEVGTHVPLGRVGTADELASAALFLLSDAASYVTGVDLIVDGGLMLK